MKTMIQTEKVCRDFPVGREVVHALKNVSISIPEKSLTILRGRSGSGKTTLLNLLGALDRPDQGRIYLDEQEISSLSNKKRDQLRRSKIGFIFQSVALISTMTAYENVEFSLRIAGYDSKKRKQRVEECLGFVGLSKRMNHRPYEMSGGEQQRVAIARAIAHSPQIIFADEPTAELDTQTGLQVVKVFQDLVEKQGVTIVMTTHDPSMTEVADKVFSLEDGEIIDGA